MQFSVDIKEDVFPVIYLNDLLRKTKVEIYSFGALLNAFVIDGKQNIIEAFISCNDAKANVADCFRSCKLSPFVCRITSSEYSFQQKKYTTGKAFKGKEALHGLLFDVDFSIKNYEASDAFACVELEYIYNKTDEGFPFAYLCNVQYILKENNELTLITSIKNISQTAMPLNDGWHPYFNLGKPIDELEFFLNSDRLIEFNDHLVPTGKMLAYKKFQSPEMFGNTFLDNTFILKNTTEASCILNNKQQNLKLEIFADASYPYLQIYIPATRNCIAIENLSSAPDSFNNKMGLIILEPGASKNFITTYCAAYY